MTVKLLGLEDEGELLWFAGLLEGEGCFMSKTNRSYTLPVIEVQMTDEDVIRRVCDIARCGNVTGPRAPQGLGRKPVWRWSVAGQAARYLMLKLLPYMGNRRFDKIVSVLS